MPKKKVVKHHKAPAHKKHILRKHFPTFYEQPIFGAGVLALALIALVLFTISR